MIKFLRENTERSLLLLILLIAAVMRFYNITGLSLSNEELSIITRIKEFSFSDFFSLPNIGDTGPAGFYTFLYLWMKIFGSSVFMIRLPFVICGILTIYFSYRLAEKWFNSHAALFVAAALCFLEFTLQCSQTARPFAPGSLITILSVWYWTKLLTDKENSKKNMIRFSITLALAAYMHYFSLIFLGIVFLSGLFLLKKEKVKWYILSLLFFLILYAPNIPVIIYQLSNPSESWLSIPWQGWFFEHIEHVFNNSFLVLYAVLGIFIISNIAGFTEVRIGKFHILSLAWFVIPIVYSFYYSLWVKPVLENAVLIFSFPFLLFFLFSFIRKEYRIYNYIALAMLIVLGIFSSVFEKDYYSTYHFGEFRDIAKKTTEWNDEYGEKKYNTCHKYKLSFLH
ncbi:MAG: glycosyltransferase family 39 protein [Bacteroidota bacterium]